MIELNGYKLLAANKAKGIGWTTPIRNEVIVNLTGKGVVNDPVNGRFVGIDLDSSRGYYRVVVGNMKRYKRLSTAKKHLTRLVPDWELRIKKSYPLFDLDVTVDEDEEDFLWLNK